MYGREKADPSDDCIGGDAVTKRSIRCRNQWTPGSLGLGVSPGRYPARCATGVGKGMIAHSFEYAEFLTALNGVSGGSRCRPILTGRSGAFVREHR